MSKQLTMPGILPFFGVIPRKLFSSYLLSFLVFFGIGIHAIGQSTNYDANAGLRLNEVNSHAARHFLSHFSMAKGVTWIRDDHYYTARFNSENTRTRVNYKSNGNFAFCLKYYRADALNGDLKSAIIKKFPGCQIISITELTDDVYKHAFFVNIKYGLYVETLRCDDQGIEITENIQDAGI